MTILPFHAKTSGQERWEEKYVIPLSVGDQLSMIQLSRNNEFAITLNNNFTVTYYDLKKETGEKFEPFQNLSRIKLSPSQKYLLGISNPEDTCILWSIETKKIVYQVKKHYRDLYYKMSPKDTYLITIEDDHLLIHETSGGSLLHEIGIESLKRKPEIKCLQCAISISSSEKWMAASCRRRINLTHDESKSTIAKVYIIELVSGKIIKELPGSTAIEAAFSSDEKKIAAALPNGLIYLYETETFNRIQTILPTNLNLETIRFSHNDQQLMRKMMFCRGLMNSVMCNSVKMKKR